MRELWQGGELFTDVVLRRVGEALVVVLGDACKSDKTLKNNRLNNIIK